MAAFSLQIVITQLLLYPDNKRPANSADMIEPYFTYDSMSSHMNKINNNSDGLIDYCLTDDYSLNKSRYSRDDIFPLQR